MPTPADHAIEGDALERAYQEVHRRVTQPIRDQVDEIDKALEELFKMAFTSAELRRRCDAEAKKLEDQKAALEAQMISLVPEYRAAKERLKQLSVMADQLRKDVLTAEGEHKRRLLADYIDRIVLRFDPAGKHPNDCKLDEVVVHTKDGAVPVKVFDSAAVSRNYQKLNRRITCAEWTPERRAKASESQRWRFERQRLAKQVK